MQIKIPFSITLFGILGLLVLFFSSNSNGVAGVSNVGCGGAGCHQPDTATAINIQGLPASGYIQGQSYALQLMVSNLSKQGAGFNMSVTGGSLLAGAGMQLNGSQELYHTSPQLLTGGNATWNFTWIAPTSGIAPIVFFVAGNAVNLNNNAQYDAFNTNQFSLNSAASSVAPTVTMNATTNITSSSAIVHALVNANNSQTICTIEYGTNISYGNTINTQPSSFNGTADSSVTASLTGLLPATTYHYRLKAMNAIGTTYSNDMMFVTSPSAIESTLLTSASFFPNPCSNFITCQLQVNTLPELMLVLNSLGQPIVVPMVFEGNGRYRIHTTNLPNGRYALMVQQAKRKQFAVFLKQ